MESMNKLDKYAVAVKGKDGDVIGHLPLGKSGKFAKIVFWKGHKCWRRTWDESSMSIILSHRRKVYNYPPRKTQRTLVKFLKFTQKYRQM